MAGLIPMGSCYSANFLRSLTKDISDMRESTFVEMQLRTGKWKGEKKGPRKPGKKTLLTFYEHDSERSPRESKSNLQGFQTPFNLPNS
ncbi:MAG: hypothetical protein JWM11_2025 [Planctomycetaceae bacterium]|nr:hypothetical protein [Planctomycetaceae bacterium]